MKAPPKSALLDRRLRHERIAIFNNRRGNSLTSKISILEKNRPTRKGRGGRPAKTDTASHCVMVRFNDTEHARFLTMYEQSGLLSKAAFIKARVFGDVFRVIETDRGTLEYVAKLTQLHAQYRAIGVNYNQVVKELCTRFSERKALSLLYKLEKATMQLVEINRRIVAHSEEFGERWQSASFTSYFAASKSAYAVREPVLLCRSTEWDCCAASCRRTCAKDSCRAGY